MSGLANQLIELVHPGLQNPALFYTAGVGAAGATALELFKHRHESEVAAREAPIADPDIAEVTRISNSRSRTAERLGYYAAVAGATLFLMNAAHPFSRHSHVEGSASVVLDGSYAADAKDVAGLDGNTITRLQAGVEGSLKAAGQNDVPFAFVVEGARAQVADSVPATHKDLGRTRARIAHILDPIFRNGSSLAEGAQQAQSLTDNNANSIIIIAANANEKEAAGLRDLRVQIRRHYPNDTIHAIVVGEGQGQYQVGNEELTSPVDPQVFKDALGAQNVQEARSSGDIADKISQIIQAGHTVEQTKDKHIYKDGAILALLLGGLLAAGRRMSGLSRLITRRR